MEVTSVNKTKNELEFEIHGASETLLGPLRITLLPIQTLSMLLITWAT